MAKWPKPAEGSWTEHYPELGTGPVSFRDSTSPEFYELEREAVFKRAWLNVGRVEELPRVGSYFTKEIDAARASVIVVKGRDEQIRAFYNICRHRGNKLVWNDFPNEETKGTCRQFTCKYHAWRYGLDGALTFVQQPGEFFDLDNSRVRVESGPVRHLERVHLHQLRPGTQAEPARLPRTDDHRARRLSVRIDDGALRFRRAQQQQLEDLRRRLSGVLPRSVVAFAAGAVGGAPAQPDVRVRALPDRRSAPAGLHRGHPAMAARSGVHVSGRAGHAQWTRGAVAGTRDAPVGWLESRRHRTVGNHELPDLPQPGDPHLPRLVSAVPVLADVAQHAQVRGVQRLSSGEHRARAHRTRGRVRGAQGVRAAGRGHARRHPGRARVRRRRRLTRSTTRRSWCGICTRCRWTGWSGTRPKSVRWGCER